MAIILENENMSYPNLWLLKYSRKTKKQPGRLLFFALIINKQKRNKLN